MSVVAKRRAGPLKNYIRILFFLLSAWKADPTFQVEKTFIPTDTNHVFSLNEY